MAGTVGQYQQGAFSTPINGTTADASVVLSNDNNNRTKHNSHDNDATIHIQSSVLASRPAAGTAQRVWVTTDGLRAYVDSGASWAELAYLSLASGGTVAGNVTVSGSTAVQALTATSATVNAGDTNANLILGNTSDVSAFGTVQFRSGTGKRSWLIGGQNNVDQSFEITPSTANGGTTFTTPALTINGTTNAAVFAAGITATTGTFSGQIVSTNASEFDIDSKPGSATKLRLQRSGGTGGVDIHAGNSATVNAAFSDAGALALRAGLTCTTISASGAVQAQAGLTTQIGGAASYGRPSLVLYSNRNLTDTTGSSVTLASYELPAASLNTNNQLLRITIRGRDSGVTTTGGTSAGRVIGIQFGATSIAVGGEPFSSNVPANEFELVILVMRTGAATQDTSYRLVSTGATVSAAANAYPAVSILSTGTAAETLANAITINIVGASSNDGGSATNGTLTVEQVLIEHLST
jgi:hypothetical protein